MQYIVTAVLYQSSDPAKTGPRMLTGEIAMSCFGLGIGWILSTVRVVEGIEKIKDNLYAEGTATTDEQLTCLIMRMLAH